MNLRKIAIQLLIVLNFISVIPAANSQQGNVRGPKNSSPRYSEPQLQIQPGTKSDTYGPIVSSDTLWQISQNYRSNSSLSVYQVMQAIYEINPDAFEQQNINLLKDGSILKMPSEAYIFNVNNRQAQQKAQLDILSFKSNISNKLIEQTSNAAALEQTKELMEQKLEAIDEAQNRQFTAIRKQFSESINSVQSILDNNKKLSERLSKVNADIDEMRSEEQKKSLQMNQMGQSIEELLEKSRQDDAVKAAQMAEKNNSWLGNTITIILLFTLPVLFALIAFAYWMIKRKVPTVVKPEDDSSDDLSLDPFATEMGNLSGALSAEVSPQNNDKLDGGDLFGDDDLFDDVLSEELEELVEDALGDNIEDSLIDNSESVDELEDDDLDSLFDEDDDLLADVKDNDDNSELKKILLEEDEQQVNADADDMKQDEGEPPLVPDDETFAKSAVDEEEPAEISIDDLLNESEDEIIENPLLDDSDDINEEALQKPDKEITAQSKELDSVTDTLLDELVQMRSMLSDDDDEAQQLLGGAESQLDIQALDDLVAEIEEVLVDKLDTEADISEVLNEAQQIEAEELAESEPLVEAEELAELEKALEDFEKEESDVLTSNEPATSSSLNDLAFSADDFVTKDESNQSFSSPPPTQDDSESIDDFDDSELDNAFDDTIDGLSFESSQNSTDELDDLPGLGDWLVEDEVKSNQKQTDATEDDGIIEELEGSSFDEMLESIDLDNDLSLDEDDTGFDIAALLDETPKSEDLDVSKQDTEDFLDVEALLSESFDADDEMDKVLDLDIPLEPFVNEQDNLEMIDVDADDGLGAKLDLAHAYIEIGEDDSARELFDEILQKGTADQIAEVKTILNKLD
ncbi:FimV/HubP family polar landmark protein [uncultured Paraglaciecola sp.]|uniref:FimV/HubP family polar landmark protein n=1 Tax=uncultured Paraglaciecola sp. TaxID=1765024 RepID=UPI00262121BD|nr:FimV/HubP family polar landmark protein [uncultured Paraglaciecola sp.]